MAEQMENYVIKSNRESGFGRYDIMMLPKKEALPGRNHYGFAFDGKNVLIGSDGENIQYQQNPVFVILTWQKQWLNTARTIFLHRLDSLCSHRQISQIRVYCHYFSKEKYNQYLNSRGQRLKRCPFSHFRYFLQQNPS